MNISFEKKTPPSRVEIDKVTLKPVEMAQPAELYLRVEVDPGHVIHRPATPKDLEAYARQFGEFQAAQDPARKRAELEAKAKKLHDELVAVGAEIDGLPAAPPPEPEPEPEADPLDELRALVDEQAKQIAHLQAAAVAPKP